MRLREAPHGQSRQHRVFEIAEAHFARTGGEERRPQAQEAVGDVVVVAGDLDLHPVLRPLHAVGAVPERDDVVLVAQAQKIVAAD